MLLDELNNLIGTHIETLTTFEVFNADYMSDNYSHKKDWAEQWKNKPTKWAEFVSQLDAHWQKHFETECKKNADAIALAYEGKLQEYRNELAKTRADLKAANKKLEKVLSIINEEE